MISNEYDVFYGYTCFQIVQKQIKKIIQSKDKKNPKYNIPVLFLLLLHMSKNRKITMSEIMYISYMTSFMRSVLIFLHSQLLSIVQRYDGVL